MARSHLREIRWNNCCKNPHKLAAPPPQNTLQKMGGYLLVIKTRKLIVSWSPPCVSSALCPAKRRTRTRARYDISRTVTIVTAANYAAPLTMTLEMANIKQAQRNRPTTPSANDWTSFGSCAEFCHVFAPVGCWSSVLWSIILWYFQCDHCEHILIIEPTGIKLSDK